MEHNIGKTIAMLRKQKGWTQVELAEQLGVSDKAVSKWEAGSGFPEISQFPAMAKIFDVSIDYLMTGKIDEPVVNLDDMDANKRFLYLLERDDVENFQKYGYVAAELLFDRDGIESRHGKKYYIYGGIYKFKAMKIFVACGEKLLEWLQKGNVLPFLNYNRSLVGAMYDHIDDFVYMSCLAGRIDFLKAINFKDLFVVGEHDTENSSYRSNNSIISQSHIFSCNKDTAYRIDWETFDNIFNDENVPKKVKDYLFEVEPYSSEISKLSFLADDLLSRVCSFGDEQLLAKHLDGLYKREQELIQILSSKEIHLNNGGYCYQKIYLVERVCVYGKIVVASEVLIKGLLKQKRDNMAKLLSDYNQKLNEKIAKLKAYTYSDDDEEIKRIRINLDKNASDYDKFIANSCCDGLLDLQLLLKKLPYQETDDAVKTLENKIGSWKKYAKKAMNEHPIHRCEYVENCITNGDYKSIYQFAMSINDEAFVKLIMNGTNDEIMQYSITKWKNEKPVITCKEGETFADACKRYKEQYYNQIIHEYENAIEKHTQNKQVENDYLRIKEDLTDDKILNFDVDTAAIKLCVRLESVLKFKFGFRAELSEMIKSLSEMNANLDKDTFEKLYRLRTYRNSVVHAEQKSIEFTKDDVVRCLKIINDLEK